MLIIKLGKFKIHGFQISFEDQREIHPKTEPCRRIQYPEAEYRIYFEPIRREVFLCSRVSSSADGLADLAPASLHL